MDNLWITANEVLDALRARQNALELSDATVDDIAGLATGHTNKALGPSREKSPNLFTLMSIVGALGLGVQLVEDPASLVGRRWVRRKKNGVVDSRISKLALRRAAPVVMAEAGRKGGTIRWKGVSPADRQQIARYLAKKRWQVARR